MAYTPTLADIEALEKQDAQIQPSVMAAQTSVPSAPYPIGQRLMQQISQMQQQTAQIPAGSKRVLQDVLGGALTGLGGGQFAQQNVLPSEPNLLDKLIQGGASFAPYAATVEAAAPASLAERLGAQSLAGGAYGGVTEKTPGAVLAGMGLGGASELAGSVLGALSPTGWARALGEKAVAGVKGLRTPEEVQEISKKVGDAPINVFEAIGSQPLARTSLTAGSLTPFSGLRSDAEDVQMAINKTSRPLYDDLMGDSTPESLTSDFQQGLQSVYKKNLKEVGNKFKQIADLADQNNIKVQGTNIQATAQDILKADKKKLISSLPGALKDRLKQLSAEEKPQETDYKDAHFAHSDLSSLERDLIAKQDYGSARIIPQLQNALQKDMGASLEGSDIPFLNNEWQDARKQFKETVVPFRDKTIYGQMLGETSPETLHTQLTNNKAASNKVLSQLPQELKNKAAAMFMKKSIKGDELNPVQLSNAYKSSIPKAAKAKLVTPEHDEQFGVLDALISSSPESRSLLNMPLNGARLIKLLGALSAGLGGANLGLSPAELGVLLPGISGAGRAAQKYITSPEAREFYATAPQRTGALEKAGKTVSRTLPMAAVPGLTSALGSQQ
jgi:hypothetical protein